MIKKSKLKIIVIKRELQSNAHLKKEKNIEIKLASSKIKKESIVQNIV